MLIVLKLNAFLLKRFFFSKQIQPIPYFFFHYDVDEFALHHFISHF